jgi:hypothetical protein
MYMGFQGVFQAKAKLPDKFDIPVELFLYRVNQSSLKTLPVPDQVTVG